MGEEVDFGWVLEMTFVITVIVGAPVIALGSLLVDLDGWTARLVYATTVAALVWFLTAIIVYGYARRSLSAHRGDGER